MYMEIFLCMRVYVDVHVHACVSLCLCVCVCVHEVGSGFAKHFLFLFIGCPMNSKSDFNLKWFWY